MCDNWDPVNASFFRPTGANGLGLVLLRYVIGRSRVRACESVEEEWTRGTWVRRALNTAKKGVTVLLFDW